MAEIIILKFTKDDFQGKSYTDNLGCPVATAFKRAYPGSDVLVTDNKLVHYDKSGVVKYDMFYGNKLSFDLTDYKAIQKFYNLPMWVQFFTTKPILTVELIRQGSELESKSTTIIKA